MDIKVIDRINLGFSFLKQDCSSVLLAGFVNKNEVPNKSTKEIFNDDLFDHEFSDLHSDGWNEGNFFGNIYLPLTNEIYMNFEVHA